MMSERFRDVFVVLKCLGNVAYHRSGVVLGVWGLLRCLCGVGCLNGIGIYRW